MAGALASLLAEHTRLRAEHSARQDAVDALLADVTTMGTKSPEEQEALVARIAASMPLSTGAEEDEDDDDDEEDDDEDEEDDDEDEDEEDEEDRRRKMLRELIYEGCDDEERRRCVLAASCNRRIYSYSSTKADACSR